MRGTHVPVLGEHADIGIIPACAGNTQRYFTTVQPFRDHPRMCGEHIFDEIFPDNLRGSSPHVRGTLIRIVGLCRHIGIIPACAGNTPRPAQGRHGRRDHPRMCGEHSTCWAMAVSGEGSSPHVRGTQPLSTPHVQYLGIIPACAGNTCAIST